MRAAKAVVAALGSAVTVLTAALADDVLGTDEIGTIVATLVTAALTTWGVWQTPNADN